MEHCVYNRVYHHVRKRGKLHTYTHACTLRNIPYLHLPIALAPYKLKIAVIIFSRVSWVSSTTSRVGEKHCLHEHISNYEVLPSTWNISGMNTSKQRQMVS